MSRAALIRFLLIALILAGIGTAAAHWSTFTVEGIQGWVNFFGSWAPVVFIIAYGVTTLFFAPASLFTLASGALFGPLWGAVYSLAGASLGAVLGFLIARYIASEWIATRSGPHLSRVMNGVAQGGWRFVAFTRLVPVFPYMPQNYFYGVSRISFIEFAVTSVIFMIPSTFAYTWLGHVGMETLSGQNNWIEISLYSLAACVLIFFLPRVIRNFRRWLVAGPERHGEGKERARLVQRAEPNRNK